MLNASLPDRSFELGNDVQAAIDHILDITDRADPDYTWDDQDVIAVAVKLFLMSSSAETMHDTSRNNFALARRAWFEHKAARGSEDDT